MYCDEGDAKATDVRSTTQGTTSSVQVERWSALLRLQIRRVWLTRIYTRNNRLHSKATASWQAARSTETCTMCIHFVSFLNLRRRFNAARRSLWLYRVAQNSKPLSRIIIKSYSKSSTSLDFSPILIIKWAQEYYMFVLNTLCMT